MHLLNIRHDDDLLKSILKDIYKVYNSASLIKILKLMIQKNHDQRPTMK